MEWLTPLLVVEAKPLNSRWQHQHKGPLWWIRCLQRRFTEIAVRCLLFFIAVRQLVGFRIDHVSQIRLVM
jgi:hypothetical protein